ncbi:hypothetical protein KEM48_007458 [Puccinia striiformis f. sp. tritici PST-130]|nr:hypothetical protein KEM48_007458 [Puccinia striiformis f. sp. tritici PST-130]
MASFADLPAELIHKIIVLTIYHGPACRDYYQTLHQNHHELDHNQIGAILQKPRPHLEFREYLLALQDSMKMTTTSNRYLLTCLNLTSHGQTVFHPIH